MNVILASGAMSDFGVNWTLFATNILFFVLLLAFLCLVFRAAKLVVRAVTAAEISAKAQQDTVYLLRELIVLKSKEEKKS